MTALRVAAGWLQVAAWAACDAWTWMIEEVIP